MYQYLIIFIKGIAMGACDVVPGVSGGTVAFVTGIYEKLLNSLSCLTPKLITEVIRRGFASTWERIDGNFLLLLGLGAATGILTLAKLIMTLMTKYPPVVWSLFFSLVLASSFLLLKQVRHWDPLKVLLLCSGGALGYGVTVMSGFSGNHSILSIFFSGFVAICAMILPGISGSFILLIMGQYLFIINSLLSFDFFVILIFALGCLCGLLVFSHILKWLFRKFYQGALCLLVGVMVGSLNKLWPWKQVVSYATKSDGERVPLLEQNISPAYYEQTLGLDPMVLPCFLVIFLGITAVFMLDQVEKGY